MTDTGGYETPKRVIVAALAARDGDGGDWAYEAEDAIDALTDAGYFIVREGQAIEDGKVHDLKHEAWFEDDDQKHHSLYRLVDPQ